MIIGGENYGCEMFIRHASRVSCCNGMHRIGRHGTKANTAIIGGKLIKLLHLHNLFVSMDRYYAEKLRSN